MSDTVVTRKPYRAVWTHEPELYCVGCGQKTVWRDDAHDFYDGCTYACCVCGWKFLHPSEGKISGKDDESINELKKACLVKELAN